MKIRFLGTGAADWNAAVDGNNKEYRRNASALVDGWLLIDPGPCVPEARETFGIDPGGIKRVINTHRHSDHYCQKTMDFLQETGARFVSFEAGERKKIRGYTVSAYAANHGTCTGAVHFMIDDGTSRLFYGLDGAWLLYKEIQAIRRKHVDLAVLDATVGEVSGDYRIFEHNDLKMVREMKSSLEAYVDHFVISHMVKTLHTGHEKLSARMEKDGITAAYDGLEICF